MDIKRVNNLVDYNKNLTPEQKEENRLKALETRKKNKIERAVVKEALAKAGKAKVKVIGEDGEVKYVTAVEALSGKLIFKALDEKATIAEQIKALEFFRDSTGEKPVERSEFNADINAKVTYEQFLVETRANSTGDEF